MKRILDLAIVLLATPVLLPVVALLALLVRLKLGAPIFFVQPRAGLDGEIFNIIKFRTMLEPTDTLKTDAERLPPFGRLLRSSSLDELPEIWNVLKGEMSIVGPRPLLVQYLPLYSPEQARRHDVLPGITGWAQVNGRNALTWDEKFALDLWYVDNRSLWLDVKIVFLTVLSILRRDGISAKGEATMPVFTGDTPDGNVDQSGQSS